MRAFIVSLLCFGTTMAIQRFSPAEGSFKKVSQTCDLTKSANATFLLRLEGRDANGNVLLTFRLSTNNGRAELCLTYGEKMNCTNHYDFTVSQLKNYAQGARMTVTANAKPSPNKESVILNVPIDYSSIVSFRQVASGEDLEGFCDDVEQQ